MESNENIGEKLHSLRKERGLSQEELAEKLGVSRQTISNWENDKVRLDAVSAAEICRLFSVSMDELFLSCKSAEKPAEKPAKSAPIIILFVCLTLAALSTAIALTGLFVFKNDQTSSVITFTQKSGLIALAAIGLIVCGIAVFLLIKKFLKK